MGWKVDSRRWRRSDWARFTRKEPPAFSTIRQINSFLNAIMTSPFRVIVPATDSRFAEARRNGRGRSRSNP